MTLTTQKAREYVVQFFKKQGELVELLRVATYEEETVGTVIQVEFKFKALERSHYMDVWLENGEIKGEW